MSISLGEGWIDDIREPIAGDSFNWEGTEPAAAKKALIIHHSGTATHLNGGAEDGFSIANFHVNSRGWGGIGYHFVITHDSHPGGARVQYVGDLLSWRAHILNQNPGKVGICLVGNFLVELPGQNQLRLARQLVDFLMAPNMILPSINYSSQIFGHGLYPAQQTAGEQCPGFAGPGFSDWFNYIKGAAFPDALYSNSTPPIPVPAPIPPAPVPEPVPAPVEPTPEPVPATPVPEPTPGSVLADDYRSTLTLIEPPETKLTTEDAFAVDMTGSQSPIPIAKGTAVTVVGSFIDNDKVYFRSDKSEASDAIHNSWYGLSAEAFTPTGQVPDSIIPVKVEKNANGFLLNLSKGLAGILGALLKVFGGKKKK